MLNNGDMVAQVGPTGNGFGAALFANAALQAALLSVTEVLGSLKENGSLQQVRDRLASFEARQMAVRKDDHDALEQRFA